jgi:putative toxin-antitoxin system antitoxin component (TIGR02293 family)
MSDTLEQIITKATEIIGTQEEALCWLQSPVRALNYSTPLSIAGTQEGLNRIDDVLGQMEHGIW